MIRRVRTFVVEVIAEMKKVSWSGRKELFGSTAVVIALSVLMAALVGLLDFIFARLLSTVIR